MASWFCSSWILLWLVTQVFRTRSTDAVPTLNYRVQLNLVSFDNASRECSPGVLTTLATKTEVSKILDMISGLMSNLDQSNFTYWVGLRKGKDKCVVPSLLLRGFTWMEDGGQQAEEVQWAEEPEQTCVTDRCVALTGEFVRETVIRWGLIPVKCDNKYQFICKQSQKTPEDKESPGRPAESEPAAPEPAAPEPAVPEPADPAPAAPEPTPPNPVAPAEPVPVEPATPEHFTEVTQEPSWTSSAPPYKPESTPGTRQPETKQELPSIPEKKDDLIPDTRSELYRPDPGSDHLSGKASCEKTYFSGFRSVQFSDSDLQVRVECWSFDVVQLQCVGHPVLWRLLDGSSANFSSICHPCVDGFVKDALGGCVDVDECNTPSPCRQRCVNTVGSFRCVCSNEGGKEHLEDSVACRNMTAKVQDASLSGILIPVLIAAAAFVVLVVVVAVTAKCCLMRRSKKRAVKKAEKMAMKSKQDKDAFQSANEKTAT